MREIKFRGRLKDKSKWAFGGLSYNYGSDNPLEEAYILADNGVTYEVDPETVGQFTGLFDRSGKEIYEHDLFQVAGILVYHVKFMESGESNHEWYGGCFVLWKDADMFFPFDEYAMKNGEVIVNIFDADNL